MAITLGSAPEALTVVLSRDLPFRTVVKGQIATGAEFEWPGDTDCILALGAVELTASRSATSFVLEADAATVNAILDADVKAATLYIEQADVRIPWARGKVVER